MGRLIINEATMQLIREQTLTGYVYRQTAAPGQMAPGN